MKLKSFCTEKKTISKVKRQPSEWEKMIANETSDKKWAEDLNKHFSKEDIWMANKHIKR